MRWTSSAAVVGHPTLDRVGGRGVLHRDAQPFWLMGISVDPLREAFDM